jgi:regulatory protein
MAASPRQLAPAALFEYAVTALARRSLTMVELRQRLERRAARPEFVDEVLDRLTGLGYLDDARLAESYARFRRDYEGLGRSRVLRELRRRGVEESTAEQSVAETYSDTDELDLVRQQIRRRLGSRFGQGPINDRKQLAALFRTLLRAGFSSARIVEGLQEISSDNDWLEAFAEHSEQEFLIDG